MTIKGIFDAYKVPSVMGFYEVHETMEDIITDSDWNITNQITMSIPNNMFGSGGASIKEYFKERIEKLNDN